jgi:hypothetical protein
MARQDQMNRPIGLLCADCQGETFELCIRVLAVCNQDDSLWTELGEF